MSKITRDYIDQLYDKAIVDHVSIGGMNKNGEGLAFLTFNKKTLQVIAVTLVNNTSDRLCVYIYQNNSWAPEDCIFTLRTKPGQTLTGYPIDFFLVDGPGGIEQPEGIMIQMKNACPDNPNFA